MKRILYMTMLWGFGGIEKYMLNIFDHIDRNKYTIDVALPGLFKQQNEAALLERGINVIHYSIENISKQIKEIKQILNAGNYDVVHVMQSYVTLETYAVFALVAIAERRKHHYKVICHSHGTEDTTKSISPIKRFFRSIYRGLLRRGFSKADLLAGCSREAGEFLYGKRNDIQVFYNGIDLNGFARSYSTDELSELKNHYAVPSIAPRFITVARMSAEKNPIFALDIIRCLRNYYPQLSYIWVGDGDMHEEIAQYIEQANMTDCVHLLGIQNKVNEILVCCDYFLLPSQRESFGIVFLEAQASGLACFTSDCVPDVCDCGGVSFISLEKSAEEWATKIYHQIENRPEAKIDEALLRRFDVKETVKALSEVYDRLVES